MTSTKMHKVIKKNISIAILGTRGIPANYGGFETFAEELSTRLVKKGYIVSVYCRKPGINWSKPYYKGVRLVILPTLRHKYFDTLIHTLLSTCHVIFTKIEIVYFCNAINSIFVILPRIFGKKTIINVDGLEWKRKKWNKLGKLAYRISERIATLFADTVITDSKAIQSYYKDRFNKETVFIPYGVEVSNNSQSLEIINKYGLRSRDYILYVSRLEPENNAHILIKAYEMVKTNMPLVIVGDAPYGKSYIARLRSTTDARIKFLGSIYGEGYHQLQSNAFLYIHGSEVGGTSPALLEAMAAGNCVIVNGMPFNKEVIADSGLWFESSNVEDLKNKIEYLINHPEEVVKYRSLAVERVKKYYNWSNIIAKYETLFTSLLR